MAFSFPDAPILNQAYVSPDGQAVYVWDGTTWRMMGRDVPFTGVYKLASGTLLTTALNIDIPMPTSGYRQLELFLNDFRVDVASNWLIRFSYDNGATYQSAAAAYSIMYDLITTATAGGSPARGSGTQSGCFIGGIFTSGAGKRAMAKVELPLVDSGGYQTLRAFTDTFFTSEYRFYRCMSVNMSNIGPPTHLRIVGDTNVLQPGARWQLNGIK